MIRGEGVSRKKGAVKGELESKKQQTIDKYRRLLIFCLVFSLPPLLITMVLLYIEEVKMALMTMVGVGRVSVLSLLFFLLATPVQVGGRWRLVKEVKEIDGRFVSVWSGIDVL